MTKKRHKHVTELTKRLAGKEGREDQFIVKLRSALEKIPSEDLPAMLKVMQLFYKERDAAEVFAQYARRYKSVCLELEVSDLQELQNFVIARQIHNS